MVKDTPWVGWGVWKRKESLPGRNAKTIIIPKRTDQEKNTHKHTEDNVAQS